MIRDQGTENIIMDYNLYVWENRLSQRNIKAWFNNFKGEVSNADEEQEIALKLLLNFIYYNEREVKYLCKSAYSVFQKEIIKEFILEGHSIDEAKSMFSEYLKRYKFSCIGRPSESGCFILYYFRQINCLPLSFFLERLDDITENTESLILVDDFLGTGDTAVLFWESPIIQNIIKNSQIKLYYMVLSALEIGLNKVKANTNFKIICPQIFGEEYRVFSNSSFIFPQEEKKESAKKVCEFYGNNLEGGKYALGYKGSEALLGFHHNIPNNTLPVIWSDKKGWFPLFPREKKIYKMGDINE